MIDVGEKSPTRRRAVAQGRITMARETVALIRDKRLPKGDPLALAEAAGILAAKRTADLIPLCHPLALDSVRLRSEIVDDTTIELVCEVVCTGKTGVEMEALQGVTSALLTVYDLAKANDPVISISDVLLRTKEGGKSGDWRNPRWSGDYPGGGDRAHGAGAGSELAGVRSVTLTVSDRCSRGEAEDRSGARIADFLAARGSSPVERRTVPDDRGAIQTAILSMIEGDRADLVLVTGGTGLSPRDGTPEAIRELLARPIPGIGELLRATGSRKTPMAWLSRGEAGIVERGGQRALVIELPGSERAVVEGLEALDPVLEHAIEIVRGGDHPRRGSSR